MQPILWISDSEIGLLTQQDFYTQFGIAQLVNNQCVFGEFALHNFKAKPLSCVHRYWQQLSYEPVKFKANQVRHFADIAYFQLQQNLQSLGSGESIVVVVSDSFNHQQLSLILGIIKALDLVVCQIISLGLVNALAQNSSNVELHLQWQLHQLILTRFEDKNQLRVTDKNTFSELGYLDFIEFLAQKVNKQLILQSRYDATHSAQAEQALFNFCQRLLEQPSVNVPFEYDDISVQLADDFVFEQAKQFFNPIITKIPNNQKISCNKLIYPVLNLLNIQAKTATTQQLFQAVDTITKQTSNEAAKPDSTQLITSVIQTHSDDLHINDEPKVTHLLIDGMAYPLKNNGYIDSQGKLTEIASNAIAQFTLNHQQQFLITPIAAQQLSLRLNHQVIQQTCAIHLLDQLTIETNINLQFIHVHNAQE